MQKLICAQFGQAEERFNALLDDGWVVIPETYHVLGASVYEQNEAPKSQQPAIKRRQVNYIAAVLEKNGTA